MVRVWSQNYAVALQERVENTAHSLYLASKLLLHEAARLGYAFTG
jgi:hypothetical protein